MCCSPLRPRIEQLRPEQQTQPPGPRPVDPARPQPQSSVVRALTAQLSQLKEHHRAELTRLAALAAAQGENLQLRRRLRRPAPAAPQ
ncbi:MAG: hypothetical protein LC790_09740 [Actinobacteria bacterium]|nr:hypothetical protein [Actinomycetota bacterium]